MKKPDSNFTAEELQQLDTTKLVEACLAGDEDAWQELLVRYQRLIYSIPVQAGMSHADAAEVFQTVCIKLLRKLSTLREQEKLAKWIITTTTRESWRLSRRRRSEKTNSLSNDSEELYALNEIASALPLQDEEQIVWQRHQVVNEAVALLNDKCRELITLLFLTSDEPGYEEVSRRMQMPQSSIGPTRARCLEKLRKILAGKI